jgi:sulfur carrier protein
VEILVNGEPRQIPDSFSATQLIEDMGIASQRLALEVNEEILPKSQHSGYYFSAGDKVEIVNAIGGG